LEGTFEQKKSEPPKQEVLTFDEWFTGRFWREWVVGRKNKPSEVEAKESIYRVHLKPVFGSKGLDQIGVSQVAAFRASLVERGLSEKRINNIAAVLSKALRYAVDAEVITKAPKIGLFVIERPEIESWELDEYARVLASARGYGPEWYAAVCLAGEGGLRVGEVKALRWREDVDLVGGTLTVNRQMRTGLVIGNPDGSSKTDNQFRYALDEIYRLAALPERGWHILRHTFGTHGALFGVNPWRLQLWMGHKRIDETMRYVHLAEAHRRPLAEPIAKAGMGEVDPDRRVLAMLGARGHLMGARALIEAENSASATG
jgi:integrase